MKEAYRQALVAWGTANLLFIRRWSEILPGPRDYFLTSPRPAATYLVLMGLVLLVALSGWAALMLARRSGKRPAVVTVQALFLAAAALGLYGLLAEAVVFFGSPRPTLLAILLSILLGAGIASWLQWRHKGWHRKILPVAVTLMLVLSPLAPILFAQGTILGLQDASAAPQWDPSPTGGDPEPPVNQTEGGRVVWIVLDELDQRLVFDERPPGLELPEFDRLREEGFSASNAQAPADRTLLSMPTLTTGRPLSHVEADGPDRLLLEFADDHTSASWSGTDTVFSRAHEQGRQVGVAGTYHPYCRVFRDFLNECTFFGYESGHEGLPHEIRSHIDETAAKLPFPPLRTAVHTLTGIGRPLVELHQESAIMNHKTLVPEAVAYASDPQLDLVLIHLLVPHPAGFEDHGHGYWDRTEERFATGPGPTYVDNLALADRTLGEIRTSMQEAGVWNTTTVIVTSDHGYRYDLWGESSGTKAHAPDLHRQTDHRVPLLIRPATQDATPHAYNETLNLIVLRGFIEEALYAGVDDTREIATWFRENGTGQEPRYTRY